MTISQWLIFLIVLNLIHFLGTYKLYQKAGKKAYYALIPVYNIAVILKIIQRPWWWLFLFILPTINLIMCAVLWVETLKVFGREKFRDGLLGVITIGFYLFIINYDKDVFYRKKIDRSKRSSSAETLSSIIFAVVVATLVHNYFIQPYIIPTGSLEKSLLVGDFLLVSKFHYGTRVPTTAVSFPLVHDTLPILKKRSYLKKPQYPLVRLPAIQKVKRNDIVVFNWPADTVRQFFVSEKRVDKPIDKKSNYVKRCVGLPGDTLQIIDGFVHISGIKNKLPERAKLLFPYRIYSNKGISSKKLSDLGIKDFERRYRISNITQARFQAIHSKILYTRGTTPEDFSVVTDYRGLPLDLVKSQNLQVSEILEREKTLFITPEQAGILNSVTWLDSLKQQINREQTPNEMFFPNKIPFNWNEDNFGPIILPRKGATIRLSKQNLPLYKKLIVDYENNQLETNTDNILINGNKATEYTFQQDYYWMMGDNRHRSEDSRFWGFVPADHIVGKPIFIWLSIEGFTEGIKNWRIRWDRVFTTVSGKGQPKSYFIHFIGALFVWQVIVIYGKRKKKKKKS